MNKELLKELEEQNTLLAKMPKHFFKDTQSIPEGFFENFEENFFAKLKENKPKQTSIPIWQSINFKKSMAAVMTSAILGFGIFTILKNDSNDMKFSQNELKSYLQDEGELMDIESSDTTLSKEITLENISKEEIQEYFKEQEDLEINSI